MQRTIKAIFETSYKFHFWGLRKELLGFSISVTFLLLCWFCGFWLWLAVPVGTHTNGRLNSEPSWATFHKMWNGKYIATGRFQFSKQKIKNGS